MSKETIEILKMIAADSKPALAVECAAYVGGLARNYDVMKAGAPFKMQEIASRHGLTRQAVSRRIQAFRALQAEIAA